jgi:uroporphyrinogen decarboxylase
MEKLEILLDTLKGQNTEHTLFSLWKHFPYDDRDPKKLAETHVKFYNQHGFDLMKISPHGRYPVVDFGCKVDEEYDTITGSTRCKECTIKSLQDWENLEPVDTSEGEFGNQLLTVKYIHKELEILPKMMTVFSPLMVASKMDTNLVKNLREKPDIMIEALHILQEVMLEFALSSLDEGAEGIFLASQHLRKTELNWDEVGRFEISFLKKILSKLEKKAEFTVLHVHGQEIYFKEVSELLEVDALNWHDQLTWPSMSESALLFDKGLLAGIDETKTLVDGEAPNIVKNIQNAIKVSEENERRIIISPGCVIPITASDKSIETISNIFKSLRK